MFHELVNHNDDLRCLVEKGYAVAIDSNYLIVRDVPYLDANGALQWGAIVAKLVYIDERRVTQDDHQVWFAGGVPHSLDGKEQDLPAIMKAFENEDWFWHGTERPAESLTTAELTPRTS